MLSSANIFFSRRFSSLNSPEFSRHSLSLFSSEQVKEAFDNSIVMTVTTTAHLMLKIVCFQEGRPVHAGKLRSLVGMHDNSVLWLSPPHGSQQGLQNELGCRTALQ